MNQEWGGELDINNENEYDCELTTVEMMISTPSYSNKH